MASATKCHGSPREKGNCTKGPLDFQAYLISWVCEHLEDEMTCVEASGCSMERKYQPQSTKCQQNHVHSLLVSPGAIPSRDGGGPAGGGHSGCCFAGCRQNPLN